MKTIEKAAEECANVLSGLNKENENTRTISITFKDIDNYLNAAFKAGVEFAKQWISVKDELPEVDIEVIIKTVNLKYSIAKMYIPKDYNGTILGEKEWKGSGTFKSSITHWRQINLV